MQEIITLTVFVPFAVVYMDQPLKLDFVWAGLCLLGAVIFHLPQLTRCLPAAAASAAAAAGSPAMSFSGCTSRSAAGYLLSYPVPDGDMR